MNVNPWDGHERRSLPPPVRQINMDGDHFDRTMVLLLEAIEANNKALAELRDTMPASIATGVAAAVTDEKVTEALMDNMQRVAGKRATQAAGHGVWWLLRTALSKWILVGVVVVLVANAAGVDAAGAAWRLLTGGKP